MLQSKEKPTYTRRRPATLHNALANLADLSRRPTATNRRRPLRRGLSRQLRAGNLLLSLDGKRAQVNINIFYGQTLCRVSVPLDEAAAAAAAAADFRRGQNKAADFRSCNRTDCPFGQPICLPPAARLDSRFVSLSSCLLRRQSIKRLTLTTPS